MLHYSCAVLLFTSFFTGMCKWVNFMIFNTFKFSLLIVNNLKLGVLYIYAILLDISAYPPATFFLFLLYRKYSPFSIIYDVEMISHVV